VAHGVLGVETRGRILRVRCSSVSRPSPRHLQMPHKRNNAAPHPGVSTTEPVLTPWDSAHAVVFGSRRGLRLTPWSSAHAAGFCSRRGLRAWREWRSGGR
jgi:hypothetical protein